MGFGLDLERQAIRYDVERWFQYEWVIDPITGAPVPPVQGGAGRIRVDHWSWTPEFRVRLEGDFTGIRPWVELSVGYSLLRFDEFDLEPVTYRLGNPIGSGDPAFHVVYGRRNESTFRFGVGTGLVWDISETWSIAAGYHILLQPGYRLRSVFETDSGIHTYGYSIRKVRYGRVSAGVTRRW